MAFAATSQDSRVHRRLKFLAVAWLTLLLAACTFAVPPDPPPLPKMESIAIKSEGPSDELKTRFGVSQDMSSTGTGAGVGFGAGTAAGIGAALTCGPFALLCATLTVPAGALIGTAGGGLAGKAADANKRPPEEQLLELDKLFVEIAQQRTIHLEIQEALERQVTPARLEDATEADALVELKLTDVRFTLTAGDAYSLTIESKAKYQWNRDMRHIPYPTRKYEYSSRSLPIEDWIKNGGKTLNMAFDACVEGVAEQIAAEIRFMGPQQDKSQKQTWVP